MKVRALTMVIDIEVKDLEEAIKCVRRFEDKTIVRLWTSFGTGVLEIFYNLFKSLFITLVSFSTR